MDNNNISNFKLFVQANPFLISYIRDGKKTWQELYEMYDIIGDNEDGWNKYLEDNNKTNKNNKNYFEDIINMAKKVDIEKVQEGISSLQKTLTLFGDLFVGKDSNSSKGYNPRPLYRRFED